MTGFLTIGNVDLHDGIMLPDLHCLRHLAVDAAGHQGHSLLDADGKIVALINALRREDLHENGDQLLFPLLHAKGHDLKAQIISIFIHRQAGKTVGLTEDHPAGVLKAER